MKLYKLTDEQNYTRKGKSNETIWGKGISHTAEGEGGLCTDGVIHAYEHPLLAVFLNPIHAGIKDPILWEAEGDVVARQGQIKCGVKTLTTLKRIDLPVISLEQRVEIAILCSLEVCKEPNYVEWAHRWLSGEDRSAKSAKSAKSAARAAYAAGAAVAADADAATAAGRAAYAANAAAYAAYQATRAVDAAYARASGGDFDLLSIIQKVVEKEEK